MPRHAALFRLKLRKGIYQARFTRNTKEHRLSTGERDKGRAKQKAARVVLAHDAGGSCKVCWAAPKTVAAPVKRLSEEFLKSLNNSQSEAYRKRAATDLSQYIEERWTDPLEITSKAWEAWKLELHSTPTARRGHLTWGSIANLGNTLRAFLRYCAEVGAITSVPEIKNPTSKQLAADRKHPRPLTEDEQGMFLWALALEGEARPLRVYLTLFETWMRKGALEAMTPRWLNYQRESITIPSAFTKAQKGDVEIDLTPKAAEAIRAERGEPVVLDQPIFGEFDYRYLFPRIAELAGVDLTGLTAHHVTRRTAATLAGEKPGASLLALKSQGGWRTSSVVDLYMRPSVGAARKVTR